MIYDQFVLENGTHDAFNVKILSQKVERMLTAAS